MAKRALVTLVVGENYAVAWRKFCEPSWRRYAQKYDLDLICLEAPLDTSKRAQERSMAWQKCLVLGHEVVRRYEQVAWVDADILINNRIAPDVFAGVPPGKVGVVEEITFTAKGTEMLPRMGELWPHLKPMIRHTPREYYMAWGLPDSWGHDYSVVNTGVMVLSPQHHREVLEKVYCDYEEKKGREWHMEQRPLSYELNRAGVIQFIDERFNSLWLAEKFLHYPFLLKPEPSRARRWLRRLTKQCVGTCINVAFARSFFFHIGGMQIEEMRLVNA